MLIRHAMGYAIEMEGNVINRKFLIICHTVRKIQEEDIPIGINYNFCKNILLRIIDSVDFIL